MEQITSWGLRPKIGRANLYLGDNTNACTTPIIWDWASATINDDLIGFVAADYTEATGLTGNTTTKYLRCSKGAGLNLASFTNGRNIHLAAYVRTGSNEGSDVSGTSDGVGTYALAISNAGNTYVFMGANVTSAADSSGKGFYLSTRTVTNNAVTYKNGTALVTDSVADTSTLGGVAYMMHAINVSGSVVANTSRAISYYGTGFGITAALQTPYRVAVRNVQVAKGRNVE
jgi:hypothetical protein